MNEKNQIHLTAALVDELQKKCLSWSELWEKTHDPNLQAVLQKLIAQHPEWKTQEKPLFSIIETLWFAIIEFYSRLQLQEHRLKDLKKILFKPHKECINWFTYYITEVLLHQKPIYILCDPNYKAMICDDKTFFNIVHRGELQSHLSIALHELIKEKLPDLYTPVSFFAFNELSPIETQVIQAMRDTSCKSITIMPKINEQPKVEIEEFISNKTPFNQLMNTENYQYIGFTQQQGKIKSIIKRTRL